MCSSQLITGKHAYTQESMPVYAITGRIVDKVNPLRPVPEKYQLLDPAHEFCWELMQACWKANKEDRIGSREAHEWLCAGKRPSLAPTRLVLN